MKKLNNKGFSLVELIVVVLIMAIIAVALAPQVMKWVENSRKSTDCSNYDSIVTAANQALANEKVMADLASGDVTIATSGLNGSVWSITGDTDNHVTDMMKSVLGDGWTDALKVKASAPEALDTKGDKVTGTNAGKYVITLKKGGYVERTQCPNNKDIT